MRSYVVSWAMNVYDINDTGAPNVLLTGEADFLQEFAGILSRKGVAFSILPALDLLDELESESDFDGVGKQLSEEYGPYADRLVFDLHPEGGIFTHIVDLSVTSPAEHRLTIDYAATFNPKATVIVNVLTATATEIGMMTETGNRVIGVALVPSVMSTMTTMDMAAGLNTEARHIDSAKGLLRQLGYTVEVVQDRVGLVQMRVLAMLINEAAFAVMEGLATPEDIDKAMMLGVNYPKGLLAWADEIGIAIVTLILDGLRREYEQERYRPCVLLKQMMRAGWTGKAAGRGFYTYKQPL
ncbi:MAG: 3-hydroxyacyl-CoA dehydrogenase family protein [Bacteroidota bacterium]